jgi:predicted ester cyclase
MTNDELKTKVRMLFENGFNQGDYSLVEELIHSNYVDHSTMPAPAPGIEGFKKRIVSLRKTFPDVNFRVDDIFVDGNKVALRWTVRGTDTGGFRDGPPSGKEVLVTGINIEYIFDGKIIDHWSSPDNLGMLQQLGVIPRLG